MVSEEKSFGSLVLGEKFLNIFVVYGRGGHVGHVPRDVRTTFRPHPQPLEAYISPVVSEEKSFESDDGQRLKRACHFYKVPQVCWAK